MVMHNGVTSHQSPDFHQDDNRDRLGDPPGVAGGNVAGVGGESEYTGQSPGAAGKAAPTTRGGGHPDANPQYRRKPDEPAVPDLSNAHRGGAGIGSAIAGQGSSGSQPHDRPGRTDRHDPGRGPGQSGTSGAGGAGGRGNTGGGGSSSGSRDNR